MSITITISDGAAKDFTRSDLARQFFPRMVESVESALDIDELELDFDVAQRARVVRTCTCRSTDHYHADTCPFGPDDRYPNPRRL